MDFHVLPAIDVSAGHLALFRKGEREPVEAFDGDPLAAARAFMSAGATWVHVVDMDLAFDGIISNLEVVRSVADMGLRVQASGGVTSRSQITAFLEAGAERAVLGSASLGDRNRVERLVAEFGERLVIGLEVRDGTIQARGDAARGTQTFGLADALSWLAGVPVSRVLVTAVERVGGLGGPDLTTIGVVRRALDVPVIAAGGVATLDQVRLVRDGGAEGVVLGRAALEGVLDLAAALRLGDRPPE